MENIIPTFFYSIENKLRWKDRRITSFQVKKGHVIALQKKKLKMR